MQVLSNLNFKNSAITLSQFLDFPDNPKLGTIIFKHDGIFLYAENIVTGKNEWISLLDLTKANASYIHTQDIESNQWHITHNLNTQNLFAVVYNENNISQIGANIEFINDNEINLNFVDPIKGKAIIFAASVNASPSNIYTKEQIDKLLKDFSPEGGIQKIKAGTVISLNSDQQPTIEVIQEPDGSATINFGIPKGKDGNSLTFSIGNVETVEPNENADVVNSGTDTNIILDFKIPKGKSSVGDTGLFMKIIAPVDTTFTCEDENLLIKTDQLPNPVTVRKWIWNWQPIWK